MTTATIKKPTSIHDLGVKWQDFGDYFCGRILIGYGYRAFIWVGCNYSSLPNYKLNSASQYGEVELVVFGGEDGRELDLSEFVSQVLLPEEMKRLGLTPGVVQKNMNHRTAFKVFKLVHFMVSL